MLKQHIQQHRLVGLIYSYNAVIDKLGGFSRSICFKNWGKLRQFVSYRLCRVIRISLQLDVHYSVHHINPTRPNRGY